MKVFIFEPQQDRSEIRTNVSERFNIIMKKLSFCFPTGLDLDKIKDDTSKSIWSQQNDKSNTLIIAHYSDVEKHFTNLETFQNAICVFHTHASSWYQDRIVQNKDVIRIVNGVNRFCIDSTTLEVKVDVFVQDILNGKEAKLAFDTLIEYDAELENFLEPFQSIMPFKECWNESKMEENGKRKIYNQREALRAHVQK